MSEPEPMDTTAIPESQRVKIDKLLTRYHIESRTGLHGPEHSLPGLIQPTNAQNRVSDDEEESMSYSTSATDSSYLPIQPPPPNVTDAQCDDPFMVPPPLGIKRPPIIIPPDRKNLSVSEIYMLGHYIVCFDVGGERRLCMPQYLNKVLKDFDLETIGHFRLEMNITCMKCSVVQEDILKQLGVIPKSAPSCGLISETEAYRLATALLERREPHVEIYRHENMKRPFCIRVKHDTFGQCFGYFYPQFYTSPTSICIECESCNCAFEPTRFITHIHFQDVRCVQWGFEPKNWRRYIQIADKKSVPEDIVKLFEYTINKFDEMELKTSEIILKDNQLVDLPLRNTPSDKVSQPLKPLIITTLPPVIKVEKNLSTPPPTKEYYNKKRRLIGSLKEPKHELLQVVIKSETPVDEENELENILRQASLEVSDKTKNLVNKIQAKHNDKIMQLTEENAKLLKMIEESKLEHSKEISVLVSGLNQYITSITQHYEFQIANLTSNLADPNSQHHSMTNHTAINLTKASLDRDPSVVLKHK